MIESNRSAVSLIALAAMAVVVGCGGGASYKSTRSAPASGGGSYAYSPSAAAEAAPASAGGDYGGGGGYSGSTATATGGYAPTPAAGGGYAPTAPAPAPKVAADSAGKKSAPAPTAMPPVTIETKTTVTVTPTPYPPPGAYDDQQSPTGGLLTAAIWDDHSHRPEFNTFLARYPSFATQWGIEMSKRVTLRVEDSKGVLVGDAPIALRAPNGSVVNLRTHGDGTTYFWPTTSMLTYNQQGGTFAVAAQAGTLRKEAWFTAPTSDTTWTIRLDGIPTRAQAPALDVAFVVDCTGSMGDEITYLQNEIAGVVKRAKEAHAMRRVRLGLVLYRDRGDEFVSKSFGFTEDLNTYLSWLKTARAEGGGDMPESVNAALADTVQKLDWAGDETGRLAFLVADAPPHYYADEQYTYKNAIVDLNARGVKLVTVGASGIDKSTEYVFRQMSAYTGGRYVFLTDDSGIGDSHLVPDISNYQVEHLDKILVRAIADEARSFKR